MNELSFSWHPLWWLGITAVIAIIYRGWATRAYHSLVDFLSLVLLLLSTISLFLALIEPSIIQTSNDRTLAGLIDISDSMGGIPERKDINGSKNGEKIGKLFEEFSALKPSTVHAFARGVSEQLSDFTSLQTIRSTSGNIRTDRSELLKGIQSSTNTPLLLITDGWMTGSTEEELLTLAKSRQAPIFPLIPSVDKIRRSETIKISNLTAPFQSPAKTAAEIRASIRNDLSEPKEGELIIKDQDSVIFKKIVTIQPFQEVPFSAKSDQNIEGFHKIEAIFNPTDKNLSLSKRTVFINSQKREKILLLSSHSEEAKVLEDVLFSQAYDLSSIVVQGENIPKFSDFSVVILNNVSAQSLGTSRLDSLIPFIEKGGGVVMIGGNKSFGLGGFRGTVIEPYLPVKLLPPRAAQKRVNSAVALVIDKSNSMGELRKLDYAKEAAMEVVRNLKDDDYVGVIGFDQLPFVVVKTAPLSENREQALERIKFLYPKNGTNLVPAMDEARRQLSKARAGRKHIIVLTDGMLRADQNFLIQMAEEFRDEGITTSTVLIGLYQDSTMSNIARLGGGTYHQTNDPTALPRIFLADIKVNAGEKTLRETSSYSVVKKPTKTPITEVQSLPSIDGFVETIPNPAASLEFSINTEDGERPLLAQLKSGKGKVIALTTDAAGRWTGNWVRWSKFSQLWTDILSAARDFSGNDSTTRYDLTVSQKYGLVELNIALYDESAVAKFTANLNDSQLQFQTIAPGHLRALIRDPAPGTYTLSPKVGEKDLAKSSFEVEAASLMEDPNLGFNTTLLRKIAVETGGLINPSPEYLAQLNSTIKSNRSYSPQLALMSLIAFLFSIAIRLLKLINKNSSRIIARDLKNRPEK